MKVSVEQSSKSWMKKTKTLEKIEKIYIQNEHSKDTNVNVDACQISEVNSEKCIP